MEQGVAFLDGVGISEGDRGKLAPPEGAAASPLLDETAEFLKELAFCTPVELGGRGRTPSARYATRFCRTIDEDGRTELIPAWPYVLEDCLHFERGDDVHDEKTRQMLATWLTASQHLWRLQIVPNGSGFFLSRKEKLVDDGGIKSTPFSMFGRMRHLYNLLPDRLKEYAPVEFSHLRATCERTKSYVTGEGTSDDPGRGATIGRADADEAARIPGTQWFAALRRACPRGFRQRSTPNGKNNVFARTKFENRGRFVFLRKHWTRHPYRRAGLYYPLDAEGQPILSKPRAPWYDAACESMTVDDIARELDISYEHSVSGQVWPEYDEDTHLTWAAVYDVNLPLWAAMDFGGGAATTCVFFQIHGREMWIIGDYESWNGDVDDHAPAIWAKAQAIGYRGGKHEIRFTGDPAGNSRELTRKDSTVVRAYQAHGFTNFSVAPRKSVKDSIRQVRRKFKRNEIFIHMQCSHIRRRITDYRYRTDDMGNVTPGEVVAETGSEHLMDAIRYGCLKVFTIDDSLPARVETPAPLKEPIPFGRELDRHEERGAFRPIMSRRREF